MYGQLPEGMKQLEGHEIMKLQSSYKQDKNLRLLICDYQRLRNIERLNVRQHDENRRLIAATLQRTDHLPLSDGVIVLCQHVLDLRHDIRRLKTMRRTYRFAAAVRLREVRRWKRLYLQMTATAYVMMLLFVLKEVIMQWLGSR